MPELLSKLTTVLDLFAGPVMAGNPALSKGFPSGASHMGGSIVAGARTQVSARTRGGQIGDDERRPIYVQTRISEVDQGALSALRHDQQVGRIALSVSRTICCPNG